MQDKNTLFRTKPDTDRRKKAVFTAKSPPPKGGASRAASPYATKAFGRNAPLCGQQAAPGEARRRDFITPPMSGVPFTSGIDVLLLRRIARDTARDGRSEFPGTADGLRAGAERGIRLAVATALGARRLADAGPLETPPERPGSILHEGHYVRTGMSRTVPAAPVKFSERTGKRLRKRFPDYRTQNRSIRNIRGARRTDPSGQARLRTTKHPTEKRGGQRGFTK